MQSPVCGVHGVVISRLERPDLIKTSLEKLLNICHPEYSKHIINGNLAPASTDEEIRKSVSKGIGLASANNFESIIDFLNEVYSGKYMVLYIILIFIKLRLLQKNKDSSVLQEQINSKKTQESRLSRLLVTFLVMLLLRK